MKIVIAMILMLSANALGAEGGIKSGGGSPTTGTTPMIVENVFEGLSRVEGLARACFRTQNQRGVRGPLSEGDCRSIRQALVQVQDLAKDQPEAGVRLQRTVAMVNAYCPAVRPVSAGAVVSNEEIFYRQENEK